MALPTSVPLTPQAAYAQSADMASHILATVTWHKDRIAQNTPVPIEVLLSLFDELSRSKDAGQTLAQVPNLESYAQAIVGGTYSITAAFNTTVTKGTAINDWIQAHVPTDGAGGIVVRKFATSGPTTEATLDPTTLAGLTPLLNDFIAAVTT